MLPKRAKNAGSGYKQRPGLLLTAQSTFTPSHGMNLFGVNSYFSYLAVQFILKIDGVGVYLQFAVFAFYDGKPNPKDQPSNKTFKLNFQTEISTLKPNKNVHEAGEYNFVLNPCPLHHPSDILVTLGLHLANGDQGHLETFRNGGKTSDMATDVRVGGAGVSRVVVAEGKTKREHRHCLVAKIVPNANRIRRQIRAFAKGVRRGRWRLYIHSRGATIVPNFNLRVGNFTHRKHSSTTRAGLSNLILPRQTSGTKRIRRRFQATSQAAAQQQGRHPPAGGVIAGLCAAGAAGGNGGIAAAVVGVIGRPLPTISEATTTTTTTAFTNVSSANTSPEKVFLRWHAGNHEEVRRHIIECITEQRRNADLIHLRFNGEISCTPLDHPRPHGYVKNSETNCHHAGGGYANEKTRKANLLPHPWRVNPFRKLLARGHPGRGWGLLLHLSRACLAALKERVRTNGLDFSAISAQQQPRSLCKVFRHSWRSHDGSNWVIITVMSMPMSKITVEQLRVSAVEFQNQFQLVLRSEDLSCFEETETSSAESNIVDVFGTLSAKTHEAQSNNHLNFFLQQFETGGFIDT
ncbi:unnamed protein product, partial [Nesidiocoris tenuis]